MKYIVSLLLAIILISIPKSVNAGEISKKDQKYIIGIHNIYRGSLRLKKLEWSADLASSAKNWAGMLENNECPLVHSPAEIRNNYGENLYAGWSSDSHYHISVRKGGYAWAKEKSYYWYKDNSCAENKICGHYTQMVWKDTQRIGCAIARCNTPEQTTEILICHYDPPGNYTGELPY